MILAKQGVQPALRNGKIAYETNQKPGGPWLYLKYSEHNCTLLRTFVFELISKKLPRDEQFIPLECQTCYKVVARPESLSDLMILKGIMADMGFASKCGIEKRESVDALYGGYWYCGNLKEGIERLAQVRKALSETKIQSFLKRGCTEYEIYFGPSDQWEIKPGQKAIEAEIYKRLTIDNAKRAQTKDDITEIIKSWVIFAAELGPEYIGSHNYVTYGDDNGKKGES